MTQLNRFTKDVLAVMLVIWAFSVLLTGCKSVKSSAMDEAMLDAADRCIAGISMTVKKKPDNEYYKLDCDVLDKPTQDAEDI